MTVLPFLSSITMIALIFLLFIPLVSAHSLMSDPESTSSETCRLGGEPAFGIEYCRGPCDMRRVKKGWVNYGPNKPAATYARGQTVEIKYQRNNHGPGGFNRFTIVKHQDAMNKKIHEQNAFWFSCWGANPVVANSYERTRHKYGYSIAGNDGEEHHFSPAFYVTKIKIPVCVPDGDYILGWVWFGGTGTKVQSNNQQRPWPYGYFGDYWSCSYIRIRGGVPLQQHCRPVFQNDMKQYSNAGCMAANDSPGVCSWEPCKRNGHYQLPRPFKKGSPPYLRPSNFGGRNSHGSTNRNRHSGSTSYEPTCSCIVRSQTCDNKLASQTGGKCKPWTNSRQQPYHCKRTCCDFCKRTRYRSATCNYNNVKLVC